MKVELLENFTLRQLENLVQIETGAFGTGGLNEWHLVPFIRHGRVYIARECDKMVGLIQYMRDWENPDKAYLMGVSIAQAMRGQGIGTFLIRASLHALKKEDIQEVELTVDPGNLVAINIYEGKLGFVENGIRRDEYGAGENRVVMILQLENLI